MSWLPDYLREAWEPTAEDLERLRDPLDPIITKYEQVYQPIRHKMFAHRDIAVDINMLLGKTLVSDVEHILYTLRDVLEGVWHLYMNGTRPALGKRVYDDESRISEATRTVMAALTAAKGA